MWQNSLKYPYLPVPVNFSEEAGSVGSQNGSKKSKKVEIVGITVGVSIVLSGLIICFVWKRKMPLQSVRKDKIGHRGTTNL